MSKKPPFPHDVDLWKQVSGHVTPLSPQNRYREALPPYPKQRLLPGELITPPPLQPRLERPSMPPGPSLMQKRGRPPQIEGRLDLHGFTQDQAFQALQRFLYASQQQGRRCVLVITGKGQSPSPTLPQGRPSILREALPPWLNQLREQVGSFQVAKPQDGGTGAFYVFLKRHP